MQVSESDSDREPDDPFGYRAQVPVIDRALMAFSAEPRSWTPRSLSAAVAKAGGWSQTLVHARLLHFGTDGVAEHYGAHR